MASVYKIEAKQNKTKTKNKKSLRNILDIFILNKNRRKSNL